jgi:hypothetical protein
MCPSVLPNGRSSAEPTWCNKVVAEREGACYSHGMLGEDSDGQSSHDKSSSALRWIAAVLALGVLGVGIYAVFRSTNGSGTAALLVIGPLALFVIVFNDRIRSMEFGGARVQLAVRVRDSLGRAFALRLSGNYEQAQAEIEDAFNQFVAHERHKVRKDYAESRQYRNKVLKQLGGYVADNFDGQVLRTAASVSFLPLIDAVMTVNGKRVLEVLHAHEKNWCPQLTERVRKEGTLRTAVIVRPGPDLNVMKLVEMLEQEVRHGALSIDCFLLVQNCKESQSTSRIRFCEQVNRHGMHAKSLVWQPSSGSDMLQAAYLAAIMTICDPSHCGFSIAAESRPELSPAASQPRMQVP